ncbi:hypothetical protein Tco_1219150 [Tanacetum coccineum]
MVVLILCYFIIIMDLTSSLGRICLGENIYGSPSEKIEGHGDWDAPEYADTADSKEKKVTKALSFYKMETDKVSERYIIPCFVNSLEAYDGEINLALDENLISNEYTVKLCLDYEVKKGNKEDDVDPGVIFGRSFMRLVNGIVDFSSGVITVYPEQDSFEDDSEKTEKSMDDWDQLLDFNFEDIPQLDVGMAKAPETDGENQNPNRLGRVRGRNKVELDGMIKEKEEKAIKVKGEAFKEEDDPGAFIFPIRFEEPMGIFTNVLCQVGVTTIIAKFLILDIPIDRDAPIVVGRGFLYIIGGIVNTLERLFSTFDGIFHQTFHATRSDVQRTAKSDSDDEEEYEIKRNKFGAPMYGPKLVAYLNCNDPAE